MNGVYAIYSDNKDRLLDRQKEMLFVIIKRQYVSMVHIMELLEQLFIQSINVSIMNHELRCAISSTVFRRQFLFWHSF